MMFPRPPIPRQALLRTHGNRINEFERRKHIVEVEYPKVLELNKQYENEFNRLRDIIRILKGKNPYHGNQKIVEIPIHVNTEEDVRKKVNQARNMFLIELKEEKKKTRIDMLQLFKTRLEKRNPQGLTGEQYQQWFLRTITNDLEQLTRKKPTEEKNDNSKI